MDITPRVPVHGPFYNAMKHIVAELIKDASSWPFLHPVDVEAVTDYYSYIKDPMGKFAIAVSSELMRQEQVLGSKICHHSFSI